MYTVWNNLCLTNVIKSSKFCPLGRCIENLQLGMLVLKNMENCYSLDKLKQIRESMEYWHMMLKTIKRIFLLVKDFCRLSWFEI